MDSIGKRLEYLIEKKGITAYELSSSTGISQSTLSRMIHKSSKPNLKNSETLAKYFHITKEWLINGSSEDNFEPNHFLESDSHYEAIKKEGIEDPSQKENGDETRSFDRLIKTIDYFIEENKRLRLENERLKSKTD